MPACFRGARLRIHLCPQKKGGDAFLLCGQHQPARSSEVENLRIADNLDDDGAQHSAAEGIGPGSQGVGRVGCAHQDHAIRREPKFGQTGRCETAIFETRKILSDPDQLAGCARPVGQTEKEACRAGVCCLYLMKGAGDQPATQQGIDTGMTERGAPACLVLPKDGMKELSGSFQLFEYRSHLICSLFVPLSESKERESSFPITPSYDYIFLDFSDPAQATQSDRKPAELYATILGSIASKFSALQRPDEKCSIEELAALTIIIEPEKK